MDLDLSRIDYLQVGLTNPKTMRLLPSASLKSQQKVAIGDHDGVLQVFGLKKGSEVSHTFKTLPCQGKQITRVELGGALGTVKDKIFASFSNRESSSSSGSAGSSGGKNVVRGYTKKGKLFLDFDTNLTESIKSIAISGSHLMVA